MRRADASPSRSHSRLSDGTHAMMTRGGKPSAFTAPDTLEVLMNTRHLVDPEIAPFLDLFPPLQFAPETLPQIRAMMAEMTEQQQPLLPAFPDIDVRDRHVPGPHGAPDVRVLTYVPKSA